MMSEFFSALALTSALSLDTFATCFSYGASKIKIPILQVFIINFICTAMLALSLFLGSLLSEVININVAKYLSFSLLLLIGVIKLGSELFKTWMKKSKTQSRNMSFKLFNFNFVFKIFCDCREADLDKNKILSISESLILSFVLSLDSLGVGLASGLGDYSYLWIIVSSFIIGLFAVCLGDVFGRNIAKKIKVNIAWLGGVILIILAVLKLF